MTGLGDETVTFTEMESVSGAAGRAPLGPDLGLQAVLFNLRHFYNHSPYPFNCSAVNSHSGQWLAALGQSLKQ